MFNSTDSGVTWTQHLHPLAYGSAVASSGDGVKVVAVGTNDDIYTSTDSGVTWTNRTTGTSLSGLSWISVTSSSDGTKLAAAVGSGPNLNRISPGGDIYTSTDSGVTWTNRTTGTSLAGLNWSSITSSGDGTKLAATVYDGDIYTSGDGGTTWTNITTGTSLSGLNWDSLTSSADGAELAATVYGGEIWTGVFTVPPAPPPAPAGGGGGMIVGSGPLAPSAQGLSGYTAPRPQIDYPNGAIGYLGATTTASTSTPTAPTTTASSTPITTPQTTLSASSSPFVIDRQLWDEGSDILTLQQFLNTHGYVLTPTGNGSPGSETNFFGLYTYQALIKFQEAHGLPATGFLGPLTRAAINSL